MHAFAQPFLDLTNIYHPVAQIHHKIMYRNSKNRLVHQTLIDTDRFRLKKMQQQTESKSKEWQEARTQIKETTKKWHLDQEQYK
jgi:hypothetical protein